MQTVRFRSLWLYIVTQLVNNFARENKVIQMQCAMFNLPVVSFVSCWLPFCRPFILGTQAKKWKTTLAHRFIELLHVKTQKLTRLYQQNIDSLKRQCTKLPQTHSTCSANYCNAHHCLIRFNSSSTSPWHSLRTNCGRWQVIQRDHVHSYTTPFFSHGHS